MTLQARTYDFFHPNIFHFIAMSGAEQQRWVEEYRGSRAADLERMTTRSLLLLRGREIEKGREILGSALELLQSIQGGVSTSIFHVSERWYYSVFAYSCFCDENFEGAHEALDQAHEAVTAAIDLDRFLYPLALHCMDFRFQRARIARSQRNWRAMAFHIKAAREILRGSFPFCTLGDGTTIFISSVCSFYESITLSPEERESLRSLLDEEYRLNMYEQTTRRTYALLGMVIPYR